MRVAIGSDPAAFEYAESVAVAVRRGTADRRIMICGIGVGASLAANNTSAVMGVTSHDSHR